MLFSFCPNVTKFGILILEQEIDADEQRLQFAENSQSSSSVFHAIFICPLPPPTAATSVVSDEVSGSESSNNITSDHSQ
jgi:hypothetical protein